MARNFNKIKLLFSFSIYNKICPRLGKNVIKYLRIKQQQMLSEYYNFSVWHYGKRTIEI